MIRFGQLLERKVAPMRPIRSASLEGASTASVTIEAATPADADAVVEIARSTPWDKSAYLRRQVDAGNVRVAKRNDVTVGFITWNREFFGLPFVWLAVVAPAHRRQGVAARLFADIEARTAGQRLYSSTNRSHVAMQRFFEGRGYVRVGEVDMDPGDPEMFYRLDR